MSTSVVVALNNALQLYALLSYAAIFFFSTFVFVYLPE